MLTDALLHPAIQTVASEPPAMPVDGDSWIVGADPTGPWADKADAIATYQGGSWTFVTPINGMRVYDIGAAQDIRYRDGWTRAIAPAAPAGGAINDVEARAAISSLIAVLAQAGILPEA